MVGLLQDLRYGFRTLRNSPGFVLAGVLALAFGIGINSMVFTLLNSVALRPIPVKDAEEVITVYQIFRGARGRHVHGTQSYLSYPEYSTYKEQNQTLSGIVAYARANLTLRGNEARRVSGQLATCNYFSVLAGPMAMGRGFDDKECGAPGANPVVVLNHSFWQREFAGDNGILGQTIVLNGSHFTIVGVAERGFRGASIEPVDVWTPISMQEQWIPGREFLDDANLSWLQVAGRLKPGVSLAAARADLDVIAARLDQQNPGRTTTLSVDRATLMNVPQGRDILLTVGAVVLAAVSLVLVIACANLANLLLARAVVRQKEIAIRLAVGASRARLIRQLIAESMLVSVAGGCLGLLLAWQLLSVIYPFFIARLPEEAQFITLNFTPDIRILLYSLFLSFATGLGFGLLPAWQASRLNLNSVLKEGSGGFAGTKNRFRGALIATQIAVCLVLLIATGLLVRGLYAAQTIDPGIRMQGIAVAAFDLPRQGYDELRATEFHRQLLERLGGRLGEEQVALADSVPLSGGRREYQIALEGRQGFVQITNASISPSYFQLVGIPIVKGRGFIEGDIGSAPVAVVSESTARRFWPAEDPLGKRFTFDGVALDFTVIGVAKDVRATSLARIDETYVYFIDSPSFHQSAHVLARGTAGHAALAKVIRDEAQRLDPNVLVQVSKLEDNLDLFRLPSQITAVLGLVLGLAGLLLASVGIYGVMSYAVAQRTKEIGIRMSLGADRRQVLRMVLLQAMRPVAVGIVIGLAGCVAVSRLLSSLLFGVSPVDPLVFVSVCTFLVIVAALASYAPARRAALTDPMTALRRE